jgi:hypothetical protein
MSFVKLKDNFFVQNYTANKSIIAYGEVNKKNKLHDISYDDITLDDVIKNQILNVIPQEYQFKFEIKLMKINNYIGPHVDHGDRTTINFYIKTDNCKTQFYKFRKEEENPVKIIYPIWVDGEKISINDSPNKGSYSGGNIDSTLLVKTESFIAKDNEVYCLDISQPHSVIPLNYTSYSESSNTRRIAVMLGTSLPYTVVCEFLRQTGNID